MDEQPNRRAAFSRHIKEHPVLSSLAGVIAVLSGVNISTVVGTVRAIDSVATKDYVDTALGAYVADENKRIAAVENGMARIQAFTEIVPQLKDLLTLRCMGTPNLNATIDSLERQYQELTKEAYREPPCDRLVLAPR